MPLGIQDLFSLSQGGITGVNVNLYTPVAYPLSLPTTPSFRKLRLTAQHSVSVSRSPFTLESQVQAFANEMWRVEVELPEMDRQTAAEWQGFLLLLGGQVGTFMLGDPLGKTPRGVATGAPQVALDDQTGRSLVTLGWTGGITGILKAGDYIQIGEHLHILTRDANSDSAGQATLDIWPRLRSSPAAFSSILVSNCKGLFRLSSSGYDISESVAGGIYTISFSAEEAL